MNDSCLRQVCRSSKFYVLLLNSKTFHSNYRDDARVTLLCRPTEILQRLIQLNYGWTDTKDSDTK